MPGVRLSEVTKQAILSDITSGMTQESVARKYSVSVRSVGRLFHDLRNAPVPPIVAESNQSRRAKMVDKAYVAVEAGLDCPEDAYKRAGVGVQALKGLGEWDSDAPRNTISVLAIPAQFADLFEAQKQVIDVEATVEE